MNTSLVNRAQAIIRLNATGSVGRSAGPGKAPSRYSLMKKDSVSWRPSWTSSGPSPSWLKRVSSVGAGVAGPYCSKARMSTGWRVQAICFSASTMSGFSQGPLGAQ